MCVAMFIFALYIYVYLTNTLYTIHCTLEFHSATYFVDELAIYVLKIYILQVLVCKTRQASSACRTELRRVLRLQAC